MPALKQRVEMHMQFRRRHSIHRTRAISDHGALSDASGHPGGLGRRFSERSALSAGLAGGYARWGAPGGGRVWRRDPGVCRRPMYRHPVSGQSAAAASRCGPGRRRGEIAGRGVRPPPAPTDGEISPAAEWFHRQRRKPRTPVHPPRRRRRAPPAPCKAVRSIPAPLTPDRRPTAWKFAIFHERSSADKLNGTLRQQGFESDVLSSAG